MLTINVVTLFPEMFEAALRVSILGRAVVQLRPGALGDRESAAADSHYDGLLSPPSYTRPPSYRGMDVPAVLLSGDHEQIARWRQAEAERLTRERRPDLWARNAGE